MHRHGYKGKKFNRERDQREALIKSLAEALIINESIETTLIKAKEIVPYVEKLITKAKKNDLHNRRQIIASLQTVSSAHKLVDEIAPKLTARNSGHLKVERTRLRRGDNAQLARVAFVDDLAVAPVSKSVSDTKAADKDVPASVKPVAKGTLKKPVEAKKSKTYSAKPVDVERKWYILDASEIPMGRLATIAATLLTGKGKPMFTSHIDTGDFVIVINSDKLVFTGNKKGEVKQYYRHSHYPGGLKSKSLNKQLEEDSTFVIKHAIRGMLPVNKLRDGRLERLKIYKDAQHKHEAQRPEILNIRETS